MPQYIRAFVHGGTFFFTVTLLERRPFTIEAIAILPDHLHCTWTLPSGAADFSTRWHDIKA